MRRSGELSPGCWTGAALRAGVLAAGCIAVMTSAMPASAQLVPGIPPISVAPPLANPDAQGGPVAVAVRTYPDLEPIGILTIFGQFLPAVTGTAVYDDNIFASQFTPV